MLKIKSLQGFPKLMQGQTYHYSMSQIIQNLSKIFFSIKHSL